MVQIVVVGSINMDLVTVASRFVAPGETLAGERFLTVAGGKGANQAVAAARLGARVSMIGAVGADLFGDQLYQGLQSEGIDVQHVRRLPDTATGTASISVAEGENCIVIVAGANAQVRPEDVRQAHDVLAGADAILVQMEIPLETVEATLRLGRQLGVPVILNPAPAQPLPLEWLAMAHFITPNQHELATLLSAPVDSDFRAVLEQQSLPLVMTRGGEGVWYRDGDQVRHQAAFSVDVVDTTGAGDTFNAALAVFLGEGLPTAVKKAAAAAALSISRLGAQSGMPTLGEVDALLERQP
ncbi:ribokinase [Frateuria aurantia]